MRLAFLMAIGVLLLGACSFKSTDDKAITANIQSKLFEDPVLKTRDIHVDSRQGVVTVSGTVGTDLEKAAVERLAAQEDGVKQVVDRLSMTSQSAGSAPEAAQTAAIAPPAEPVAPPARPREQRAAEKPHRATHTGTVSKEDQASAQLEAYTNSVTPEGGANPAPAAAAAPSPSPAPVQAPPPPAAPAPPVPVPAPKPQEHVTIPDGTVVTVRMVDSIDSSRNQAGEEFAATLDSPIVVDGRALASRGADARVRLARAKTAGTMTGQSELQLELVAVTINGVSCPTKSGYYQQHGVSRGTRTAETVGGGAVLGALIGGILGHGKGAAIGSIAGAGAGTAVQVSTKGQQVKVPSETKIDFTLKEPVTVPVGEGQ